MHQSIPAVPITPPPGQPRGICSRCQPRKWGISQFYRGGLGISIPQGDPRALMTHVFSKIAKDEAFVKDWLVHQGLEKLVDVFQGMFSQF